MCMTDKNVQQATAKRAQSRVPEREFAGSSPRQGTLGRIAEIVGLHQVLDIAAASGDNLSSYRAAS